MENIIDGKIYFADLTDEEMEQRFVRQELGDKIYDYAEKHGIKMKCGMLYSKEDSLEGFKDGFKVTIRHHGYGDSEYRRNSFIVNNVPSGDYNIIMASVLNWPSEGEGCPAFYLVGDLHWNAETKEFGFTGRDISDENVYLVDTVNCEGIVGKDDCPKNQCNWFNNGEVLFYWSSGKLSGGTGVDWISSTIMNAAVAKFVSKCSEGILED